jgi:Glycosyl hydrolases family 18
LKRIFRKLSLLLFVVLASTSGLFTYFSLRTASDTAAHISSEKRTLIDHPDRYATVLGTQTFSEVQIGGWIPNSDFQAGLDSIKMYAPELFNVQYAGAAVVESGEVGFGAKFEENMTTLNALSIPFGLNLISTRFEGSENFLKNTTQQQAFLDKALWLKKTFPNFTSVNINFENMHSNQRQPYYSFLQRVREVTKDNDILMYVTVFSRFEADKNVFETKEIHDYTYIGSLADIVVIMAYDYPMVQGGITGAFAPNSPNTWIDQVLDYATKRIDKSKLVVALPLYGYSYSNGTARPQPKSVNTYPLIQNIISKEGLKPQYDETFNEMYLERPSERLYYQDQDTLNQKKALVIKYGIDKVFYWRIGRDGGIGY